MIALHKLSLRIKPHALACFYCRHFKVDESAEMAWCDDHQPQFPALCEKYETSHGKRTQENPPA